MPSQAYWNEQRKIQGCKHLGITPNQWAYIKRVGTTLCNIYTNQCNGDESAYNKLQERIYEKRASLFAAGKNLYIYYQTDPRGATIYLDTQPIKRDSYNNAVCIY